MVKIVEKLLRAGEGRTLKRLEGLAAQVNALEEDFVRLTDAELREETDKFRARIEDGESLDDLPPEPTPPDGPGPPGLEPVGATEPQPVAVARAKATAPAPHG